MTRYTRGQQGLPEIDNKFGPLGGLRNVAVHHSAGPRARTKADCVRLNKVYDQAHRAKGWGGVGYHLGLDDAGRLYDLRPRYLKGAHVGGHNTGCFGIMLHGDYTKDRLGWRQRRTLRRLYRGKVKGLEFLGKVPWYGHQEYAGHESNACPGGSIMRYLDWLRSRGR